MEAIYLLFSGEEINIFLPMYPLKDMDETKDFPVLELNVHKVIKEKTVSVNIVETFELLFDKNNNIAYKALLES